MFLTKKINILLPTAISFIIGTCLSNFYIIKRLFNHDNQILLNKVKLFGIFYITKFTLIILISILFYIFLLLIFNKNTLIKILIILSASTFTGIFSHINQKINHENFLKKIENNSYDLIAEIKDLRDLTKGRNQFYIELLWEDENKTISLYTNTPHDLQVGDKIKVKNATFKKHNNKDFVKYLTKENIAATLFIKDFNYNLLYRPTFSFIRWINNKKNNVLNNLEFKMTTLTYATFSSMFLGNKNISKKIEEKIKNKFKEWGILHILARSGLHLVIFILICNMLFKFIPIHFFIKQIIILIISTIYMLLSWSSISFIRAFYALILYKICPFLEKKTDSLNIICLICLFITVINPLQVFFLDFQLSFILTFTLALISKIEFQKNIQNPTQIANSKA